MAWCLHKHAVFAPSLSVHLVVTDGAVNCTIITAVLNKHNKN